MTECDTADREFDRRQVVPDRLALWGPTGRSVQQAEPSRPRAPDVFVARPVAPRLGVWQLDLART